MVKSGGAAGLLWVGLVIVTLVLGRCYPKRVGPVEPVLREPRLAEDEHRAEENAHGRGGSAPRR